MSKHVSRFNVGDKVTPACKKSAFYGSPGVVVEQVASGGNVLVNVDFDGKFIPSFHECDLRLVEPAPTVKECLTVDNVNHPPHYNQGGIECIEAIKAALGDGFVAYLRGNVIKYLWRCEHKGGIEDLRKAAFYLDRAIKEMGLKDE